MEVNGTPTALPGEPSESDLLRCPFHRFQFDTAGRCVATGYGTKPPPNVATQSWPLREVNGMLLVYHGVGDRDGPP